MRLNDLHLNFNIFESLESKMDNIVQILKRIEPDLEKAQKLAKKINKADPTGDRALYTPWIAKQLAGGKNHQPNIYLEDLSRVKQTLRKFHGSSISKGFKDHRAWANDERFKDLYKYKIFHDLEGQVDDFAQLLSGEEVADVVIERQPLSHGVDQLYKDNQITIINIPKVNDNDAVDVDDHQKRYKTQNGTAASALAIGTKWCTSRPSMANSYIWNNNGLIIFQINPDAVIDFPYEHNKDGSFAQATGDFTQFADLKDRSIELNADFGIKLYEILKIEFPQSFKILTQYVKGDIPKKYGNVIYKDFPYVLSHTFNDDEMSEITTKYYKYWEIKNNDRSKGYFKLFTERHKELEDIFLYLGEQSSQLLDGLIHNYYALHYRQQWDKLEKMVVKIYNENNSSGNTYQRTNAMQYIAKIALDYVSANDGEVGHQILSIASKLPSSPPVLIKKYGESILEKLNIKQEDLDVNMRLALAINKNERDLEAETLITIENAVWITNYAKKFGRITHIEDKILHYNSSDPDTVTRYRQAVLPNQRWPKLEKLYAMAKVQDAQARNEYTTGTTTAIANYASEVHDLDTTFWGSIIHNTRAISQCIAFLKHRLPKEIEEILETSSAFATYAIKFNTRSKKYEHDMQDAYIYNGNFLHDLQNYAIKFGVRIKSIEKLPPQAAGHGDGPKWNVGQFLLYANNALKQPWPKMEHLIYNQWFSDTTELEKYLKMCCKIDPERILKAMVENGAARKFVAAFKKSCDIDNLFKAAIKYGTQSDIAFFRNQADIDGGIEDLIQARPDMSANDFIEYAMYSDSKLPSKYLVEVLKYPELIVKYAQYVLEQRWMKGEKALLKHKDPNSLVAYAAYVINGRWPNAEEYIIDSPEASFSYAVDVLENRFIAGERSIQSKRNLWTEYKKVFDVSKQAGDNDEKEQIDQ